MERGFTRREFILRGISLIAACSTLPTFLARTAQALTPDAGGDKAPPADERILVVVQLGGGNDGLNTVIPWQDDQYYRARPTLAIPRQRALALGESVALHPALVALKALWDQGQLAVVQGVGYPNPSRSHFRSMDIWHTARPDSTTENRGWLGRYFDNECSGCGPTAGLYVGETLPLALRGRQGRAVTLSQEEAVAAARLGGRPAESADELAVANLGGLGLGAGQTSVLDFIRRTALDARAAYRQVAAALDRYRGSAAFPDTHLGQDLRLVARLIGGGLPARVYYVNHTGFDTHAAQQGRHDQLLLELAEGLAAFQKELQRQGNAQRVLTFTFSEFGRRVAENASGGTDHGTAAPLFVVGAPVQGGLYGTYPSLSDLDSGDLKFHTDFRSVYATVLSRWLGADDRAILGGPFPQLGFLA